MKQRKNIDIEKSTLKVFTLAAIEAEVTTKRFIEDLLEKEAIKIKAKLIKEL